MRLHPRRGRKLVIERLEHRQVMSGDSVVTFNEIMYNPQSGDQSLEWIELHNQTSISVDLSGWMISGGVDYVFPSGTIIEGGGYVVAAADSVALAAATGFSRSLGSYERSLSNGGDSLVLQNHNGRLMDELEYDDAGEWPVGADGSGASLAKIDPHLATALSSSWRASVVVGGTPGQANEPRVAESIVLNEVAGAGDANFFVELRNVSSSPQNASGLVIKATGTGGGSYTVPAGVIPAGGVLSFSHSTLGFRPQAGERLTLLGVGQHTVLDATRVENTLRGRSDAHAGQWQRPNVGTPGTSNTFAFNDSIVINEIMYHQFPVQPAESTTQTVTVVDFASTWRFNQSGANLGANWALSSHAVNNSTWLSGAGLLGRETTPLAHPINTSLALGPNTYYFETDFQYAGDPESVARLVLAHLVDDGAVFYLNGVEIWRHNIAGQSGDPVAANVLASPGVDNAVLVDGIVLPTHALVTGLNRLSIEVHQVGAESTDVVMGAQLKLVEVVTPSTPLADDPEEWIELYNRSNQPVNLSGWKIEDGVTFTLAPGTVISPGGYIVIAGDAQTLAAKYPDITIAGQFDGSLSNSDERVVLLDSNSNIADEVHYYDSGRWSTKADGGSSSLELRDSNADNSIPEAWGPSDESADATWQTVTYSGIATTPAIGNALWNEFVFGLLGEGELLIDDISVLQQPNGAAIELIQNGSFDAGLSSWRAGGNHQQVAIVSDPENPANSVLYLASTGAAEHLYNHIETTLAGNTPIVPGVEYQISYRVRSISGSNQLNTRLYFNYLPHTELLWRDRSGGTPGRANSIAEPNIGPTYQKLSQSVVTPGPFQTMTIRVDAKDSEAIANMLLWYSANEGTWQSIPMVNTAGPSYQGTLPGFASGTIVQFYVQGTDGQGVTSTFPAAGADSRALYKVGGGATGPLNSLQILMLPSEAADMVDLTRIMSNDLVGATVIVDGEKVHYDIGARLKGSFSGRYHNDAKGFHVRFDPMDKYHGVHDSLAMNQNNLLQESVGYQMLQVAGEGVVGNYNDAIRFVSPVSTVADGNWLLLLARHSDLFLDSQYENGGDGGVFNVEASYQPISTVDGNPESPKLFVAGQWTFVSGEPDFLDYGDDPEIYRYFFQLENARKADDYSGLLDLTSIFNLSGQALYEAALKVLDLEQWVRSFAAQSLIGNDDVVTQPNLQHNFKLYQRPEDGKFLAFFWDLDRAFRVSTTAPLWGSSGQLHRLFEIPQVARLFYGHVDHLIHTNFNASYLADWVTEYASIFGNGGGHIMNPVSYVQNRAASILAQLPALAPFAITTNGGSNFAVSENSVTLTGTGSYKIRELRLNGSPGPLELTWTDATTWKVAILLRPGVNSIDLGAVDYFGNVIHSDSIVVTSTTTVPLASAANLRITELHYNPAAPSPAEIAAGFTDNNDFEFVELQNISSSVIDLQSIQFSTGINLVISGSTKLDPGERVVVVGNQAAFAKRYGSEVRVVGQWNGRLSNSGEAIALNDHAGDTIQQFTFQDGNGAGEEAWPTDPDGGGPSLVVVNMQGNYSDGTNWYSSDTIHGTPGRNEAFALPGDFNRDNTVDQADYIVWKSTFGSTTDLRADANGDSIVNLADYTVWRDNLGQTASVQSFEALSESPSDIEAEPPSASIAVAAPLVARSPVTSEADGPRTPRAKWESADSKLKVPRAEVPDELEQPTFYEQSFRKLEKRALLADVAFQWIEEQEQQKWQGLAIHLLLEDALD